MRVIRTSLLLASLRAQASPAKPPPTMTTCFIETVAFTTLTSQLAGRYSHVITASQPTPRKLAESVVNEPQGTLVLSLWTKACSGALDLGTGRTSRWGIQSKA